MSIIYDALKKVEKKYSDEKKPDTLNDLNKKKLPGIVVYLIYILVVIAGILSAKLILSLVAKVAISSSKVADRKTIIQNKDLTIPKPASTVQAVVTNKIPASLLKKDVPEEAPAPRFVLTGIFFTNQEGFVLINNKILKEGDMIDGAIISRITSEDVELKLQNELIKLRTNSN